MRLDKLIVGTLNCVPGRKIVGRKRLQKMVHLMKEGGVDVPAVYYLHHFGPYSSEIASVTDNLVITGVINEQIEPLGVFGQYIATYQNSQQPSNVNFPAKLEALVQRLNSYSTVELEVASTIAFLTSAGDSLPDAIQKTRHMKPFKAIEPVLEKAKTILSIVREAHQG